MDEVKTVAPSPMDVEDTREGRRVFLERMGRAALGVATAAYVGLRGSPAHAAIGNYGCCNLAYNRFCTAQEWSQGCGYCGSNTDVYGNPTGKWWWSCRQNDTQNRFCGECSNYRCSYTYKYSKSYGLLHCN